MSQSFPNNPEPPTPSQEELPPAAPTEGETGQPTESEARPKAPDLHGPTGSRRLVFSVTSPETRAGRWLRTTLRSLAIVLGLFAVGVIAAYFLLYRPARQDLNRVMIEATQTAGQLHNTRADLDQAQQKAQSAEAQAQQAQDQLQGELSRVAVLRAANALGAAQLAAQDQKKDAAVKALLESQVDLLKVQTQLEGVDKAQFTSIQALYVLAKNDLDRDLKLAGQDMERLQTELTSLEGKIK